MNKNDVKMKCKYKRCISFFWHSSKYESNGSRAQDPLCSYFHDCQQNEIYFLIKTWHTYKWILCFGTITVFLLKLQGGGRGGYGGSGGYGSGGYGQSQYGGSYQTSSSSGGYNRNNSNPYDRNQRGGYGGGVSDNT